MGIAEAIKEARAQVDMYGFGAQWWCVDSHSGLRAWWSGRAVRYETAQRQKRSAIIGRALELLLPADLPERWTVIDTADCYTEGTITEVVSRALEAADGTP